MSSKIDISVETVTYCKTCLYQPSSEACIYESWHPCPIPHTKLTAASTEYHEKKGPDERRKIGSCKSEAMSSGFVSGGTADDPIKRSDEWLAAQKELEENRARRAAEAQRPGERSLYEILEANKGKHTAYMTRYGLVLGLIT